MTFSRMLNVDLVALCPGTAKPDRDLLTAVDQARRIRNEIVHGERMAVSREDAVKAEQGVKALVTFIESVAERLGLPLERHV